MPQKKVTFAANLVTVLFDIQLPDNKSLVLRQMMVAYVLRGEIPSAGEADCHDVQLMCRAIRTIADARRRCLQDVTTVDVEDCGAAYRFLLPLLALTPGRWRLTGTPRLLQRPIEPLVSVLQNIGAEVKKDGNGWLVDGKSLKANELEIDSSLSSQMASALLLVASILELRTLRLSHTDVPSLSYLKMTMACTREFPVLVPGVPVPDTPVGESGDWSGALFWFAYARLHPEHWFILHPLSRESIQPDSAICEWFNDLGISISCNGSNVEIQALPLVGRPEMVLDVRDNLDTVPVMAALACLLPADITFLNVRNLRYKESDRLQALVSQLRPFAEIDASDNELRVIGKGTPLHTPLTFDTRSDHRLAMAFLLFGPHARLNDTSCLRKSYPQLASTLPKL